MNNVNDIAGELKSMGSNLGNLSRNMPYSVPEGYFEKLPESSLHLIHEVTSPEEGKVWAKAMPYQVPEGYFNALPENIITKANTRDVFPGLTGSTPFDVPQGYFENLPEKMLAAAKKAESPKTIPLKRTYEIKPIKWAAAAILMIFIGFGGAFFLGQPYTPAEKMLASVPGNEIQEYLQHNYRIDVEKIENQDISNLQVENREIVQYLNETGWDAVE